MFFEKQLHFISSDTVNSHAITEFKMTEFIKLVKKKLFSTFSLMTPLTKNSMLFYKSLWFIFLPALVNAQN